MPGRRKSDDVPRRLGKSSLDRTARQKSKSVPPEVTALVHALDREVARARRALRKAHTAAVGRRKPVPPAADDGSCAGVAGTDAGPASQRGAGGPLLGAPESVPEDVGGRDPAAPAKPDVPPAASRLGGGSGPERRSRASSGRADREPATSTGWPTVLVETIHQRVVVVPQLWPRPLDCVPAGDGKHYIGEIDVRVAEVLVATFPDEFRILGRAGAPEPETLPAPRVWDIPDGWYLPVRVRSRFATAPIADPIRFHPEGDGRHFVADVSPGIAKELVACGPHWGFEILGPARSS